MKPIFIGVAGGTGAGKSTLCTALMDTYPEHIGLIQLDDYFKPADQVPQLKGHENWDHPDSLFFDKLTQDLIELASGHSVTINTKNERLNPDYKQTDQRIPVEFQPKPIMLIEGYLVLFDERIRNLLTTSIWLEVDHETRWGRRVHFKYPEYGRDVVLPMHKQFAEPTKSYAKHIVDVAGLSKEEVLRQSEDLLRPYLDDLEKNG